MYKVECGSRRSSFPGLFFGRVIKRSDYRADNCSKVNQDVWTKKKLVGLIRAAYPSARSLSDDDEQCRFLHRAKLLEECIDVLRSVHETSKELIRMKRISR